MNSINEPSQTSSTEYTRALAKLGLAFVSLVAIVITLVPTQSGLAYNVFGGKWSSISPIYVCSSTSYSPNGAAWASALSGWFYASSPFSYSMTCSSNNVGLLDVNYSGVSWDGLAQHSPNKYANPYTAAWGYLNTYFTQPYYDAGYPYAVTSVASHELGHILGLDHEDDFCAIMNANTEDRFFFCTIWGPQTDDVNGVDYLY